MKDLERSNASELRLLSAPEFEAHKDLISSVRTQPGEGNVWWLSDKGSGKRRVAVVRDGVLDKDGEEIGGMPFVSVRPVLIFNETAFATGDKFSFMGYIWTVIDNGMALCDSFICRHIFDIDTNDYELSSLKSYLSISLRYIKEDKYSCKQREAVDLINSYFRKTFADDSSCIDLDKIDVSELANISLAYTKYDYSNAEYEIQISADLLNYSILTSINGFTVTTDRYESLSDLIKNELEWLDFDSLVAVEDEVMERYEKLMNTILTDDDTGFGGTATSCETVRDFLCDTVGITTVVQLNAELKKCGIRPITT